MLFTIDFAGSKNLVLHDGGVKEGNYHRAARERRGGRTCKSSNRAVRGASECKYSWVEEHPGQARPGVPKREEIATGIELTTTRERKPGDQFTYELTVTKDAVVRFVLDIAGSTNMRLLDADADALTSKTTVVQPHVSTSVGVVVVSQPGAAYSLQVQVLLD